MALRFDLTVPLARFAAQYHNELGLPFKRYHIGPVWRGENTQRGRYREFMQCDFDTIGVESITADIETVLVIHDLFRALGFEKFQIRVNNRKLLNGLLESLDLAERSAAILRVLDKLPKVGEAKVREELTSSLAVDGTRRPTRSSAAPSIQGSNAAILAELEAARARQRRASRDWRSSRSCCAASKPPAWAPGACSSISRSRAGSTTTPARSSRPSSPTCRRSAASARAAATTTWRSSTPRSACPASAPRSASTACSRRWRSSACSRSAARR